MRTGLAVKNPFFYAILCFLPLEVIMHSDFGLQILDFPFYLKREKYFVLLGETEPVSLSHGETVILFFQSGKNHNPVSPVVEKQEWLISLVVNHHCKVFLTESTH